MSLFRRDRNEVAGLWIVHIHRPGSHAVWWIFLQLCRGKLVWAGEKSRSMVSRSTNKRIHWLPLPTSRTREHDGVTMTAHVFVGKVDFYRKTLKCHLPIS